jgi:protein phosphatase PTC2/3
VSNLEKHDLLKDDPPAALSDAFLKANAALMIPTSNPIHHMTSGTTVAAVYFRGLDFWTAHVGDSRVVLASDNGEEIPRARELTKDHKPDDPGEMSRIIEWGGFVSPSPEPGVSARVWLDPNYSMIGLAMSRSIGDYAVKGVGVIPIPEVNQYRLTEFDKFMILASDGVWEFMESQEAVEIIHLNLHKGVEEACKVLIETATERWAEEEGNYRDDVSLR